MEDVEVVAAGAMNPTRLDRISRSARRLVAGTIQGRAECKALLRRSKTQANKDHVQRAQLMP